MHEVFLFLKVIMRLATVKVDFYHNNDDDDDDSTGLAHCFNYWVGQDSYVLYFASDMQSMPF